MAKWGEGDDRWIVEDRADGRNVGAWHWEEKNRMEWVRKRVPELLCGLKVNPAPLDANVSVTSISKIDGHASVSMRKGGKKMAIYDLNLEVAWNGKCCRDDAEEVNGTMKVHEFATGSDEDDWVVECSTTATGKDAVPLRQAAESDLKPLILKALAPLMHEMLDTL